MIKSGTTQQQTRHTIHKMNTTNDKLILLFFFFIRPIHPDFSNWIVKRWRYFPDKISCQLKKLFTILNSASEKYAGSHYIMTQCKIHCVQPSASSPDWPSKVLSALGLLVVTSFSVLGSQRDRNNNFCVIVSKLVLLESAGIFAL